MSGAWVFSGARRLEIHAACDFLPPPQLPGGRDVAQAVGAALAQPVAAPRLRELARGAARAAITIPDSSRSCPNDVILPALLNELNAAGVSDERVLVAVGCGLHRTTTAAERRTLAGEVAAARAKVVDAHGIETPQTDLGVTSLGCPVSLCAEVAACDLIISVGVLEPHQCAGYSGGVKGLAVGCAGERTILWTHRPAFISLPGVELCRLDGNPFQETLREMAARTGLRFAVTAIVNDAGGVAAVAAGDPAAVQEHLAARFASAWLATVAKPYNLIVAGIKAPKHESLYQASRAATYIGLAARPALTPDGLILLCSDLPKGPGDGPGETNFAAVLAAAGSPSELAARGLREPLGPGGHRAFLVARVLERFRVGVLGGADESLLAPLGIARFSTLGEAVATEHRALRRAPRILAVADALTTVIRTA